ncbi:MAG: tetratricopeptide repeat protein, partial [Myxococcota bacterium]
MKGKRTGLRTTVRLYGTVVDQTVCWQPRWGLSRPWRRLQSAVPTPGGVGLGEYRWLASGELEVRLSGDDSRTIGSEEEAHTWRNGAGVEVDFDRIAMVRARRTSTESLGDIALFVMMLTLLAGVGQINYLLRAVIGERVESETTLRPTPELIARLLREELSGADQGVVSRVERPEFKKTSPSFYLPAGSQGPMDRSGGGALAGGEVLRTPPNSENDDLSQAQAGQVDLVAQVTPVDDTSTQSPGLEGMIPEPVEAKTDLAALPPSVEEFVGWGFHDWLDVAESDNPTTKEMRDRLQLARELMKIDPDDPFAILTVAYYAYLSENYELCRDLYQRYVDLFPEDTAGYNNLALTFKRTRQYSLEEDLYRLALALDSANVSAKNNLAVNLAHQGRFTEAEKLMDELSLMTPNEPYAELHRAKIAAAAGERRKAYRHFKTALARASELDTFHHIEFRQDIRLDPSFDEIRHQPR